LIEPLKRNEKLQGEAGKILPCWRFGVVSFSLQECPCTFLLSHRLVSCSVYTTHSSNPFKYQKSKSNRYILKTLKPLLSFHHVNIRVSLPASIFLYHECSYHIVRSNPVTKPSPTLCLLHFARYLPHKHFRSCTVSVFLCVFFCFLLSQSVHLGPEAELRGCVWSCPPTQIGKRPGHNSARDQFLYEMLSVRLIYREVDVGTNESGSMRLIWFFCACCMNSTQVVFVKGLNSGI
jgi:hypothetical protein